MGTSFMPPNRDIEIAKTTPIKSAVSFLILLVVLGLFVLPSIGLYFPLQDQLWPFSLVEDPSFRLWILFVACWGSAGVLIWLDSKILGAKIKFRDGEIPVMWSRDRTDSHK